MTDKHPNLRPHANLRAVLDALPDLQRHGVTEVQVAPDGGLTLRMREVFLERVDPTEPDDEAPEADELDTAHLERGPEVDPD